MSERDEVFTKFFDPRTVQVDAPDDLLKIFDREAIIGLSGAFSDSRVTVSRVSTRDNGQFDAFRLEVECHIVTKMVRLLHLAPQGFWYLRNAKFRIWKRHQGQRLGVRSACIQTHSAKTLGLKEIILDAMGNLAESQNKHEDDQWSGYWVWPRVGFDGPVPAHVRAKLTGELARANMVSQLLMSSEGYKAWELHGDEVKDATFDLTAGSTSWQLLAQYCERRDIKV